MALTIKELFQDTHERYGLKLIAGANGLQRTVSWVYVCEDPSYSNYLNKNDLIISTGALTDHSNAWLKQFILAFYHSNSCAIILNVGKYISNTDISADVISLCDQLNFPLFTMPWHIHISDITKDYYNRLFSDERNYECGSFHKVLNAVDNISVLDRYVDNKLHAILEYDNLHNSSLANTLFLYLKYWGNIQDVANKCFCHRNTVTNRIRILQEKLDVDLDDPIERYELLTAFMIRDFCTTTDLSKGQL